MNMRQVIKPIWYISRRTRSAARYAFFRAFQGAYFKSVGSGTKFFGRIRFGTVEGNISVGKNCMMGHELFLSATRKAVIEIGDDCSLNTGCHLVATDRISIGSGTRVGEYASIRDQHHAFDDLSLPIHEQGFYGAPVVIGKNCWIGRGVIIMAGVTLGDGCVVGANSVVTKSFGTNYIIAGVPAKPIRERGQTKP